MNRFEYADPTTQRVVIEPTGQRPFDPATQRVEDEAIKADRVIRDADSSRSYRSEETRSYPRDADRTFSFAQSGFSGLDAAAFLFAAIMTLGPLLAGAMAGMRP